MDINSSNALFDTAENVIKTIPNVYNDGLQPTVKESGKTLSLVPRAINAALAPLQKWILYKEYSLKETELLLQEKLKHINPEKIIAPEPYVGVPTMQAISYCMDCKELRNLFANLLAKSMNIDTKYDAHPAFVEIIKQLSPLDSMILNELALHERPNKTYPSSLLSFAKEKRTPNFNLSAGLEGFIIIKHFVEFTNIDAAVDSISTSIQNIERLGLITADYTRAITNDAAYDDLKNSEVINEAEAFYNSNWCILPQYKDYKVVFQKGILEGTPLGFSFSKICCID